MDLSEQSKILDSLGRKIFILLSNIEENFPYMDVSEFAHRFRILFQPNASDQIQTEYDAIQYILNTNHEMKDEYIHPTTMSNIYRILKELKNTFKREKTSEKLTQTVKTVLKRNRGDRLNPNINVKITDYQLLLNAFARIVYTIGSIEDDVIQKKEFKDFLKLFRNLIDPENTLNITIASEMTLYILDLIDEFINQVTNREIDDYSQKCIENVTPIEDNLIERLQWLRHCIISGWNDNLLRKLGNVPDVSANPNHVPLLETDYSNTSYYSLESVEDFDESDGDDVLYPPLLLNGSQSLNNYSFYTSRREESKSGSSDENLYSINTLEEEKQEGSIEGEEEIPDKFNLTVFANKIFHRMTNEDKRLSNRIFFAHRFRKVFYDSIYDSTSEYNAISKILNSKEELMIRGLLFFSREELEEIFKILKDIFDEYNMLNEEGSGDSIDSFVSQ